MGSCSGNGALRRRPGSLRHTYLTPNWLF